MSDNLAHELQRLSDNAAMRREDLLLTALAKSRRRKNLTIVAGVLALVSAAAIATFLTRAIGEYGMQALAAAVAFVSGTISLVVAAHYGEDEVFGRLSGASKYLTLRDSVYRLAMDTDMPERARFKQFATLQHEYANLDGSYSRYFTGSLTAGTSPSFHHGIRQVPPGFIARCLDSRPRNLMQAARPKAPLPDDES